MLPTDAAGEKREPEDAPCSIPSPEPAVESTTAMEVVEETGSSSLASQPAVESKKTTATAAATTLEVVDEPLFSFPPSFVAAVQSKTLDEMMPLPSVPASKHALIICDLQTVALNALPEHLRRALLDMVNILVDAAQVANYKVVFSGLQFSKNYQEIPSHHKLFGAFKRLYEKTGTAHWFVKDEDATQMCLGEEANEQNTIWRSAHMPPILEFTKQLQSDGYTHVAVVGIKTGYAVQATVQALCDLGLRVSVIEECIMDDDIERHEAILKHLIPVYASVISMSDWLEHALGLERLKSKMDNAVVFDPTLRYICDVGRGGHMWLYSQHLLKKSWCVYPKQPWYTDEYSGKSYKCPLGKQALDFCDEPQFSKISLYVKGREWLDEKDKIFELAADLMPTTYLVEHQRWCGGKEPENYHEEVLCFVKECDKNGGRAVQVSGSLSDALVQCDSHTKYVIQTHVPNPLLTNDGHKCHIKAYFLLKESYGQWQLLMYPDAFLSVGTVPWSEEEQSPEAQITVKRNLRLKKRQDCDIWKGWPMGYESCCELVGQIVQRAISSNKLQSRETSQQFEIFSADIMIDSDYKPWLIECNFGCVLFDPTVGQALTTTGLVTYQQLYDLHGEDAVVNDHNMIADTMALVMDQSTDTQWDVVGTYSS